MFAALGLAITWPNYAALISLSSQYIVAASDAQRAILIAGADYVSALLASPLIAIYTILVPGICALIASVGPLLVSALDIAIFIVSALTLIWFLLVGYKLLRLGQQ